MTSLNVADMRIGDAYQRFPARMVAWLNVFHLWLLRIILQLH